MNKIASGTYDIIEWKGAKYYRFSSGDWMQLVGYSLFYANNKELEEVYTIMGLIQRFKAGEEGLEDEIQALQMNILVGEL
jgi:hypothetical protein